VTGDQVKIGSELKNLKSRKGGSFGQGRRLDGGVRRGRASGSTFSRGKGKQEN